MRVVLKPGAAGRAAIVVKGKGTALPMPALPLAVPVRVQVQSSDGRCWAATLTTVGKGTPTAFRATAR